jgi:hypothetical protein
MYRPPADGGVPAVAHCQGGGGHGANGRSGGGRGRGRAVTEAVAAAAMAAEAGAAATAEVGDRIHAKDLNRSHHMDHIGRDFSRSWRPYPCQGFESIPSHGPYRS